MVGSNIYSCLSGFVLLTCLYSDTITILLMFVQPSKMKEICRTSKEHDFSDTPYYCYNDLYCFLCFDSCQNLQFESSSLHNKTNSRKSNSSKQVIYTTNKVILNMFWTTNATAHAYM